MTAPRDSHRLSDADRDRLVELLREHFAVGRFDVAEFTRRVAILLDAETGSQATAALEGLPSLPETSPSRKGGLRERLGKRHKQVAAARAGWLPTRERFRDPSSGVVMRVWVDPADAGRHYVPDDTQAR